MLQYSFLPSSSPLLSGPSDSVYIIYLTHTDCAWTLSPFVASFTFPFSSSYSLIPFSVLHCSPNIYKPSHVSVEPQFQLNRVLLSTERSSHSLVILLCSSLDFFVKRSSPSFDSMLRHSVQ